MASPLDFVNSEGFRKKLIVRNLTPYAKAPNRPTQPINTEYIQSDSSVQDSPDQLIDKFLIRGLYQIQNLMKVSMDIRMLIL